MKYSIVIIYLFIYFVFGGMKERQTKLKREIPARIYQQNTKERETRYEKHKKNMNEEKDI